jgi:hypothetical protein
MNLPLHPRGGWLKQPKSAHLVLPVLQDLVVGLLVLLHRLLQLDGIDLDAEQLRREVHIEAEDVVVIHLPALPQGSAQIIIRIIICFSAKKQGVRTDKLQVKAGKILGLDGLVRSRYHLVNRRHGARCICTAPRQPGPK